MQGRYLIICRLYPTISISQLYILKIAYGLVRVLNGARQTHLPNNIFCRYRELFHSLISGLAACGESKTCTLGVKGAVAINDYKETVKKPDGDYFLP